VPCQGLVIERKSACRAIQGASARRSLARPLQLTLAMDRARPSHPDGHTPPPTQPAPAAGRLNLLLSAAGPVAWRDESWADALARLLEPMGVQTWRVRCGREASRLLQTTPVHIALVDLALPLDAGADGNPLGAEEGGPRLLEILQRLDSPPPTVVVKRERTRREDARTLASVLDAGAFAVLERPVQLETALEVMRRILCRHYSGRWPTCG
jgi:CheY-like chemotaxis protein